MKTVAVVCEKGGVGKTLLSQELCYYYSRKNIPVSLYSLDPQYSNRTQRMDNAQVAIVDTPGSRNARVLEVIKGTDLVIIPTRPSPGVDLQPFLRTVETVKKANTPYIVVVNCWNRYKVAATFCDWLKEKKIADDLFLIPQSEAVVQAQMSGCSVFDINQTSKITVSILEVCDRVSSILCV